MRNRVDVGPCMVTCTMYLGWEWNERLRDFSGNRKHQATAGSKRTGRACTVKIEMLLEVFWDLVALIYSPMLIVISLPLLFGRLTSQLVDHATEDRLEL